MLRNIQGSSFRSWVVALCALMVAGLALITTLIIRGAENSLRLAIERLGADIVVVPQGSEIKMETAILMGHPSEMWMPQDVLDKVARVPGVERVSPQLFLSTLENASCCSVPNMFMIAYDPTTDFTIGPWLEKNIGTQLNLGEAVGGTYVFVPENQQNILLYGYLITLVANMEPTGTGLDQSMFLTFETAQDIARMSKTLALKPLEIPEGKISAIMVRTKPGQDAEKIAVDIMHSVPDITPISSLKLFQAYRSQLSSLLNSILVLMGVTLVMSVILIGLIFSMAANERRRELGVLRAMGGTRSFIFQFLLTEAGLLALIGGLAGIVLVALAVYLFRTWIMVTLGFPILLPSLPSLFIQVLIGLSLALASITLAALVPAYRISHMEPSAAMRE